MQRSIGLYSLLALGALGVATSLIKCYQLEGFTSHCIIVGIGSLTGYLAPSPIRYDAIPALNGK